MAVRTAQELISQMRMYFPENPPEGYENMLEDISDSVGNVNLDDYVNRKDYDALTMERDVAVEKYNSMREKYINRFYDGYNGITEKGYINGTVPEAEVIEKEKKTSYSDLFE